MDNVSRETRSRIMASVRPTGNLTTELAFAKALCAAGVRGYRKHWPILGKPDFAWPGRKVAVFVDGCFWHGCPKCGSIPTSNVAFWKAKIENNRRRDLRVTSTLRQQGWKVVRVWECSVKRASSIDRITRVLKAREETRLVEIDEIESDSERIERETACGIDPNRPGPRLFSRFGPKETVRIVMQRRTNSSSEHKGKKANS